ncbi:hypothetical protein [Persephonella sp.]
MKYYCSDEVKTCHECGRRFIVPTHPDDIEGWLDFKLHEDFHAKLKLTMNKFGFIEADRSKISQKEEDLLPIIFNNVYPLEKRIKAAEEFIECDFYRIILDEISKSESNEFLSCVSKEEHLLMSITTNKEGFPQEVIDELRKKYL